MAILSRFNAEIVMICPRQIALLSQLATITGFRESTYSPVLLGDGIILVLCPSFTLDLLYLSCFYRTKGTKHCIPQGKASS